MARWDAQPAGLAPTRAPGCARPPAAGESWTPEQQQAAEAELAELEQQVEDAEALELPRVPTGKVEQRVREEEAPAAEASAQPAAAEAEQPEPQLVPA